MSGKPASVAAPRAGGAGGPRVLVYVAEPRQCQLDAAETPPQAHPLDALYLQDNLPHPHHLALAKNYRPEERSFFKHYNEPDKFGSEAEYSQYIKESRSEEKVEQVKRNDWEKDGFVCGLDTGDLNYQRCGTEMHPMPAPNSDSVQSESANCERDLGKYVNYQLLEQSVSHQSIVNQSINILNQQVRSLVNENEGSQLVRTADGVVLAVLPSMVPETDPRTTQSEFPQSIVVPLGWRRIVNGTSVIYISPSGTALSTLPQLREYLQTAGTCKCGLPCPLRPETAFSFDPKVASKPYQAASGAELTKLCNHKRKLLATLQARATTPPHEQKKGVDPAKKKMKKRSGYAPNVSVSQMMVQRDRPNEFKSLEEQKRTSSPGSIVQRPINQACVPYPQQNMLDETKQDTHVQRSSHYLTVSSGWISQHPDNIDVNQKLNQSLPNTTLNVGLPVLGTNGQIIGVNTSFNKQNIKNPINVVPNIEPEKEEDKDVIQKQNKEESQIFCGLNQPLTPEVMQKINEQQQIFIQRNQKQIEVMKGYKTQMADNNQKQLIQNQYMPQNQLVIQNGAVVKTNSAKTPPWQVKRNETSTPNSIPSASSKMQKNDGSDFEVNNDETPSNLFSNEQAMNQGMCSRVPPLPQHYNMMGQQWPNADLNKKKGKANKTPKKKNNQVDANKPMMFGNNGMKFLQEKKCDDVIGSNIPSFMDDPNGYLAQQTVLLNNTISRQVGVNPSYDGHYESSTSSYNPSQEKSTCKPIKQYEPINVFRNNINSSPSPNTPDSSIVPEKVQENMMHCYKGCVPFKNSEQENQMRPKYKNIYHDMDASTSSPKHFDENPVTSSTFIERNVISNENCGPIQAGIVSTSNVSPTETLQPPEPSPTLSNSSRSTDTPHSGGSNSSQHQNCTFPMPSPAYSNPGSCRDNFNSNPPTPNSQALPYNSPQSISGTQMMHFISNHNVNKNLMEVDNISMVGVKPGLRQEIKLEPKKRFENAMPGYCPPPHLGGGPPYSLIQTNYIQTFVTTMASFSVIRDTVTSVLAGKANTATTSINASQANFVRLPPPPSVNLATTYAIPNNQPDPFINSVNLPTSYPLHIAGTTAQNMISKSPLEMVQNVISSLPSKPETSTQSLTQIGKRTSPGQILISSTGQIIVTSNHMPPPPPKNTTAMAQIGTNAVTNVTSSVTQVVPAVGGVQPIVNQPTVVVNTLPTPFVIQPPMMAVDGQVVQQNTVLPQIVAGGIVNQSTNEASRQIEVKNGQNFVQGVAMLSPESIKKRSKKKKNQTANITNVLQIAAPQQNANNIMVHSSPQHNSSPQFSPRGFQLSPTNNISPTPMLQALTIVPGKSGTPAHIVMNGQGNTSNFGSQQIITNTSPSQQINLLQPVNLINNASNVMSNFPFQQFIVPNLGGMVMTADGTTIIQDNSTGMPMQLQLQTVNGQNVLTPVQNPGVFTGTNSGVVIRQNQQGKIIQSQHSPGAQFLSPNSQVMVNSPNFNGQLSPLLANLSPTSVTFNQNPQVRSGNVQAQEFIQTNQIGQTLMVPLSPKQVSIPSASNNRSNSTFVQQNTTIVQQQTTLVSNSHNSVTNLQGNRFNVETKAKRFPDEEKEDYGKFMSDFPLLGQEFRHSVSTQTLLGQRGGKSPGGGVSGSSPPDTTTHSPLGAREASPLCGARCVSTQGNYADTTTKSPEPADVNSSGMVQCVSSSEQDMAESQERAYAAPADADASNMLNMQVMRPNRKHEDIYMGPSPMTSQHQHLIPLGSNIYDRQTYKRKNDFEPYRNEKLMRTNYMKELDYDVMDKDRHFQSTSADMKVFDRHLGSGHDTKSEEPSKFAPGDLVWGPVKGYVSWPGKLVRRCDDGLWLVRWFGEKPPSNVEDGKLLTLTEGLEAHHAARMKHRKSRKLNTLLENAIQDAMAELDKKSDTERSAGSEEEDAPKKKKDKGKKEKNFKKSLQKIERIRSTR